jgi:hypothetical protein
MSNQSSHLAIRVCLLILFIGTFSVSFPAKKPEKPRSQRVSLPARYAPVYHFGDIEEGFNSAEVNNADIIALGDQSSSEISDTVGITTYDNQSNCTMGWQIAHRQSGIIHMDWMYQPHNILGQDRDIHYQAFYEGDCSRVFEAGGIQIESEYSGYCDLDVADDGWSIPQGHINIYGDWYTTAYWDFSSMPPPPFGDFGGESPSDRFGWYHNNGTGPGNENMWPVGAYQPDAPGDPVLHVVTTETGDEIAQTASYYRRVGPYGFGNGAWSDQRLIDTVPSINVTVVASRMSGKVAIVWNAPADYKRDQPDEFDNQYENDVWYAVAHDYGAEWASVSPGPSIGHQVDLGTYEGGNITQYQPEGDWKAFCDLAAALTTTDELHIVWGCRRWTDTTSMYRRQSAIFHWKESDGIPSDVRTVVQAKYDTGGTCFGHTWGSDVAKMSISECDGMMYCLYTQFGNSSNPCGDVDNIDNVLNGYLYMSVYHPLYDRWDRGLRVTNTPETPDGCTPGDMIGPGDCNSEYWASMARFGRYDNCWTNPEDWVLDILYINDYAPGSCIQTESGVWTVNDVIWTRYPCREFNLPAMDCGDDAGLGWGICNGRPILVVAPGEDTSWTLTFENYGVDVCSVTAITITQNDANVVISVEPSPPPVILVPPYGGTQEVNVSVTVGVGATDPSTVEDTITIAYGTDGDLRKIPVCVTVSSSYVVLGNADLATTCKQLRIYSDGGLSNNNDNYSLNFPDEMDCAPIYLYDGSPIVCREVDGQTRCYLSVFRHHFADERALRQMSPVALGTDSADYIKASMEFITADTAVRLLAEYYAPTAVEDCGYMIQKLMFWNITDSVLPAVAVGEILDWDIPSFDSDMNNESGYDVSRQLLYQYACGRDPCDTMITSDRYGGIAASAERGFKNYFTLENDVWVYQSRPFGSDAPYPSDTAYELMVNNDGFHLAQPDSCEDLSTLVTFDVYDMIPGDTNCAVMILTTSRFDPNAANLSANTDLANAFIETHPEIRCEPEPGPCECIPGDVNGDGGPVGVGDAVYIIAYVFKDGAPPTPYDPCSGDANCDCAVNVGDAVYIINYVFRGGPAPCDCETWRENCGDYE